MNDNSHIKTLDASLSGAVAYLKTELTNIRGNRPSIEPVENLSVTMYDQPMTVKQLGSLSIVPPREIHITVWDREAIAPVMKAIQDAQIGLSTSNDGNTIRASLSAMSNERREEMVKLVKKHAEAARINVRTHRDDAMKALKGSRDKKELSEDEEFTLRDQAQKRVTKANEEIESLVEQKLESIKE